MASESVRRAAAFAPGHVTGLFRPARSSPDPRRQGSVGAGLVLELGVVASATWRPSVEPRLRLTSDGRGELAIATDAARHLIGSRDGEFTVRLARQLPSGQGFGTSAADAIATTLALRPLLGVRRADAVVVAHLADLFGGGGLGGVAAILGGGLEVRRTPGVPPYGKVAHRPFPGAVIVGVVGPPIPTARVLRSPRWHRRFNDAASEVDRLGGRPVWSDFLDAAERFTDRVGLASPRLRATLRALRRRGGWAFQAMFGATFVARPRTPAARPVLLDWLARAGLRAVEVRAAPVGARLLPATRASSEGPTPRRALRAP